MEATGTAVLVYDGECGFCSSSARWIARSWVRPARSEPWQRLGPAGLAALGLSVADARRCAWWIDADGRRFGAHEAVGRALTAAAGWRRVVGLVLVVPPGSWLARPAYRLVARYRGYLPGATDACRL